MRTVIVGALLTSFALPGQSSAAVLGAGPSYGSPNQQVVQCLLYNGGPDNVSISSVQIYSEFGPVNTQTFCGNELFAGFSCYFYAFIANNVAHACKAVMSDKTYVRGTFIIYAPNNQVIHSEQLN